MSEPSDTDKPTSDAVPPETPGEGQGEEAAETPQQPPKGDPVASPGPPIVPKDDVPGILDNFLPREPARATDVPWPLDRSALVDYLKGRIEQRPLTPAEAANVPVLVDVYLLEEFAPEARKGLTGKERGRDDVLVANVLCQAIGRVGGAEDAASAAESYERLLKLPAADEVLVPLIRARDALGPAVTSESMAAALKRRADRLAKSENLDEQMESRDLAETRDNDLQEINWADEARRRVNTAKTPPERLALLMEIYFERTQDGGHDYLMPWVVRQVRMHAQKHGPQSVVDALRLEVNKAAKTREEDRAAKFASVRAMRGLLYFGEDLDEQELEFFQERSSSQMDPICLERLMPQRYQDRTLPG
ncbi:MAG: hypothetical protein WBF17_12275 [Phycisphaerae bacterium]